MLGLFTQRFLGSLLPAALVLSISKYSGHIVIAVSSSYAILSNPICRKELKRLLEKRPVYGSVFL
jgi:hypothetical protein